jgi:hypothetical protein
MAFSVHMGAPLHVIAGTPFGHMDVKTQFKNFGFAFSFGIKPSWLGNSSGVPVKLMSFTLSTFVYL